MIMGQGGVVWDSLSGPEDGYDLFESCAALRRHLRRHTSRQGQSVENWVWERKIAPNLKNEFLSQMSPGPLADVSAPRGSETLQNDVRSIALGEYALKIPLGVQIGSLGVENDSV